MVDSCWYQVPMKPQIHVNFTDQTIHFSGKLPQGTALKETKSVITANR